MPGPLQIAHDMADAIYDAWRDIPLGTDLHEEVSMGADGTPTTRADAILDEAGLAEAARHGVDVLSEESGWTRRDGAEWAAVIDPLDGSRNAGRGIPFFCVSIALGRDDFSGLEAGVIKNLITGETFAAERGRGATRDGKKIGRRPFDPDEVMVAVIADNAKDEVAQEQERRGHHLRDLGSAALEMCYVGTGALDAFLVRQPWLRVIDIAAATLFVREAGGVVRQPRSKEDLNADFDLNIRIGVEAAHCEAAWEAVQ